MTSTCQNHIKRIYGDSPPQVARQTPETLGIFLIPPSGGGNGFVVPGETLMNSRRRELDMWLVDSALESGADLVRDSVVADYRQNPEGVSVDVAGRDGIFSIGADCLIGADGVHSAVRGRMGKRAVGQQVIYVQEYFRSAGRIEDNFHMVYDGDISPAYSYFMPKGDMICLGVGILIGRAPDLPTGMQRLRSMILRDFGSVLGKPDRHEGFPAPFGGIVLGRERALLVGDAAGFCNPLTGEGIGYAVATGEAAARAILEDRSDALRIYSETVKGLATEIEGLVRQTLLIENGERETRVAAKRRQAAELSSRPARGPTANP